MKQFNTLRFGEIEVDENEIVHFADGIPAFEDEHEFLIIPYDEESPYVFLQSLTTPELAFLMTMPFVFFPEYEFELDDANQEKLGLTRQEDMLVYMLLTIPDGQVESMTANLMAPIVMNQVTMQARQIVLDKSRYTTKHRLFPVKKEDK
ncbi:MAG: flagellar assembly protein FliW [Selenomonas sp.]|nr:flagellar assembly protein FliW [Selenomonas sp.]